MNNLLEQLKQARQAEQFAKSLVSQRELELKDTLAWELLQDAKNELQVANEYLATIDEAIRQEALSIYQVTLDKHPHPSVAIVINRNLIYKEEEAFDWAGRNAPNMLKLDTKKFEKHARAILETMPLTFVEVEEVPSVRIAGEL